MTTPIITSLLDTDFYKITIANFLFQNGHSDVPVSYEFRNRTTDVNLNEFFSIEDIRYQFDFVSNLRFTSDDINYLRSLGYFNEVINPNKKKTVIKGMGLAFQENLLK